MKDDDLLGVEETKDEAIEAAVAQARLEARIDDEPVGIAVCVGPPCTGNRDGCVLCDRIVVMPDGRVNRDCAKH